MESGKDGSAVDFQKLIQAFAAGSSQRWTFAARSFHSAELSRPVPSTVSVFSGQETDFRGWFLPVEGTFAVGSPHLPDFRGLDPSVSRFSPSSHANFRG